MDEENSTAVTACGQTPLTAEAAEAAEAAEKTLGILSDLGVLCG
jgi:hypothetical protein